MYIRGFVSDTFVDEFLFGAAPGCCWQSRQVVGIPELSETESKHPVCKALLRPGKRFVLVQSVLNSGCPGLGLALSLGLALGLG